MKPKLILIIISIVCLCVSCKKKPDDVSCEAVLTVTNQTGQTLNYSWGSNSYDKVLLNGASAKKDVGHIDIKYSKRGNEISHTSYNVSFNTTNFTKSILVDECNENYVVD